MYILGDQKRHCKEIKSTIVAYWVRRLLLYVRPQPEAMDIYYGLSLETVAEK